METLEGRKLSLFTVGYLRLRHTVAQFMDRFPGLYLRLHWGRSSACGRDTEIVIDGYPRSGNSFAVRALREPEGRMVNVAAFKHYSSNAILGVKKKKAVVVVVRDPEQAVTSLAVMAPYLSMRQLLHRWVLFHKRVWPYRAGMVVATFDQITQDFGAVTRRVNQRFGTHFAEFQHTEENVKKIFDRFAEQHRKRHGKIIESTIPRPSPQRAEMCERARQAFRLPKYAPLRDEAMRLYERFASYAQKPVE